jgi:YVTN family beta-propeller protein
VATIPVGKKPREVQVSPDGKRAYVADTGPDTIEVIDSASENVTATVHLADEPNALALSPNGRYLYVAEWGQKVEIVDVTDRCCPAPTSASASTACTGDPDADTARANETYRPPGVRSQLQARRHGPEPAAPPHDADRVGRGRQRTRPPGPTRRTPRLARDRAPAWPVGRQLLAAHPAP